MKRFSWEGCPPKFGVSQTMGYESYGLRELRLEIPFRRDLTFLAPVKPNKINLEEFCNLPSSRLSVSSENNNPAHFVRVETVETAAGSNFDEAKGHVKVH